MAKEVKIVQNADEPIAAEVIAEAIIRIADGMKRITASGLNRRGLMVLLAASTGMAQSHIRTVLEGLDSLRANYVSAQQEPKGKSASK